MRPFRQFINEMDDPRHLAVDFINKITSSSVWGYLPTRKDAVDILRQTVESKEYTLYRGIRLGYQTTKEKVRFQEFKIGDDVPVDLVYPNREQLVIHTTKSKAIAKTYTKGGGTQVLMELKVSPHHVLFDGTNIQKFFSADEFSDDELFDYFKRDKEVLLFKDAEIKATFLEVKIKW